MSKYLRLLEDVSLFQGIDRAGINQLIKEMNGKLKRFRKQELIAEAGEAVRWVGIICHGTVQTVMEDFLGNRTILRQYGPGEIFGESLCCAQIAYMPVSVAASSDCEVLLLDQNKLLNIYTMRGAHCEQMVENLVAILAEKNVFLNRKLEILACRSTRDKLISFLSSQAHKAGSNRFTIPFNRQELADYLCVDRSAMSSELSKLRNAGIIEYNRSDFAILHGGTDYKNKS